MNKRTLTLSGAIASSLLSALPAVQAGENPFALSAVNAAQQLAAADEKMKEGKCGADKMKVKEEKHSTSKVKEGKCGEGKCGASKMKVKEQGAENTEKQ